MTAADCRCSLSPDGARHWRLKCRFGGRERLMALGEYPDTTLKRARAKVAEARELVRAGIDPVQQGRAQRAQRVHRQCRRSILSPLVWSEKKSAKWTDGHIEQTRRSFGDYAFPKIGRPFDR